MQIDEKKTIKENSPVPEDEKRGCIYGYLVIIIFVNIVFGFLVRFFTANFFSVINMWLLLESALDSALVCLFAYAIIQKQKWGFYGICARAAVNTVIMVSLGHNPIMLFVPPIVLLVLLLRGGENSAWKQMR